MDSESKDTSESPLQRTSEIRLIRWEYQKVISTGCQECFILLDSATLNLGEKCRPKRTNQRLLGTK